MLIHRNLHHLSNLFALLRSERGAFLHGLASFFCFLSHGDEHLLAVWWRVQAPGIDIRCAQRDQTVLFWLKGKWNRNGFARYVLGTIVGKQDPVAHLGL